MPAHDLAALSHSSSSVSKRLREDYLKNHLYSKKSLWHRLGNQFTIKAVRLSPPKAETRTGVSVFFDVGIQDPFKLPLALANGWRLHGSGL
jgi:hypothetical protein